MCDLYFRIEPFQKLHLCCVGKLKENNSIGKYSPEASNIGAVCPGVGSNGGILPKLDDHVVRVVYWVQAAYW